MPCAAEKPAFDVTSVKPDSVGPENGFSLDISPNGLVIIPNLDLWNLGSDAHCLQPAQGTAPVPREHALQMLQTLLADRFKLKWHRESREGPAYGLTIARNEPKLMGIHASAANPPNASRPSLLRAIQE